jgi:hypothetical protein
MEMSDWKDAVALIIGMPGAVVALNCEISGAQQGFQ